ncbi:MAG: DNA mismatch repair protein MutS, partial [Bacteroidales bacterium]|nr:DNA mismatch repair protein MutS [Bacteroidales bacterium]
MKQYNAIKAKHPGALLLFRVGDFYETFGEDAIKASKILDIVLTKRANGAAAYIELAGFPHHSLDTYLPKLVRAGNRVAICDQLEDPKMVKGIVKRGVTELVTPGLSFNDNVLEKRVNNYLASIQINGDDSGVAFLDVSTGEFYTSTGTLEYIDNLLQNFNPSEIIYSKAKRKEFEEYFKDKYITFTPDDWVYAYDYAYEKLTNHFKTSSLKGFGIENLNSGIIAAGAILFYLEETEHKEIKHISSISRIEEEKFVWLDKFTIRNLELIFPQQEGGIPLIDILDKTITPMGGRLMKKWLIMPLKEKTPIGDRLQMVEAFYEDEELRDELESLLKHIADLERLISKVAVGRINPREMILLKRSLLQIMPVKELLTKSKVPQLHKLADQINPCEFLLNKIETELKEEVPIVSNLGNLIKDGVDNELDELRKIAFSGKDFLVQIQQREIQNTGISSLKIAYNKVFGYYLEVTNSHKDKVPTEWIRKQTLVNAERFITPELKEMEEKILTAEEKMNSMEYNLFQKIREQVSAETENIQDNSNIIAFLDCICSYSTVAVENDYVRPRISTDTNLHLKKSRHPVVEKFMQPGEEFVPNDASLNPDDEQIWIITGPNMAGKSTFLRQVGLIVFMAQIGSFVPAEEAEIGLVDRIFTRVGASDNLARGESTFLIEMNETANILNNATDHSLVLLDEIGRGTSTFDGLSIAWAVSEYLHNEKTIQAKTLFATHYHELTELAILYPKIKNYNVTVEEWDNKIIFLRKIIPGGT